MADATSKMVEVFSLGTNCSKPCNIRALWLVAINLYFLEFTEGEASSGEICYDRNLWDVSGSRFRAFCTEVTGREMELMYLPAEIERINAGNIISFSQAEFRQRDPSKARFLKEPLNLNVAAYPSDRQAPASLLSRLSMHLGCSVVNVPESLCQ